jgi:alpha-L-rhamnosidase
LCRIFVSKFQQEESVHVFKQVAVLALTVALSSAAQAHAAGPPSRLTVEQQPHPLAVENLDSPAFGWSVTDARIGAKQTAYELRVGTSPDAADTWDSGKVSSDASANVAYGGPALKPSQRYWWSVRTWDARD